MPLGDDQQDGRHRAGRAADLVGRAGEGAEGIAEIEKAKELDRTLAHTYFNLGIEFKKTGDLDRAVSEFEQMLKLTPNEAKAHYNLGQLYKLKEDNERAIEEFRLAAKLDPSMAAPQFQMYNILRRSDPAHDRTILTMPRGALAVSYQPARAPLGFALKLEESTQNLSPRGSNNEPGTSVVRLIDPRQKFNAEHVISARLPLTYHGYAIFLATDASAADKRQAANRFVTLIDTLYEARRRLVVLAAGSPEALYPKGDGAFEFERTVSRLNEMQGAEWLEAASTETVDAPVAASPQSALD